MTTAIDPHSQTWRAIEQHARTQIATLREKNDSQSLDALRTADLRGRIASWKDLLALGNPAPAEPADDGSYGY
ncbi:hypothetical protein ACQYWY_06865 [Comamonas sediminis]|uniref:hypothetical protein n=1 Tax=Comamonas sediminis TaxID=1783360 RepID=UPI003D2C7C87